MNGNLLIEVAAQVIACNTGFDLNVFGYFLVLVGAGEHVGILLDEFGNCDHIPLRDILVAIEIGREERLLPVTVHTGRE